jgi:hypothetical protein
MFNLGQVVATPGALAMLAGNGQTPSEFISRHHNREQGELGNEDHQANDESVKSKGQILSVFKAKDESKVWVITDPGHEVTTVLLPSEY